MFDKLQIIFLEKKYLFYEQKETFEKYWEYHLSSWFCSDNSWVIINSLFSNTPEIWLNLLQNLEIEKFLFRRLKTKCWIGVLKFDFRSMTLREIYQCLYHKRLS